MENKLLASLDSQLSALGFQLSAVSLHEPTAKGDLVIFKLLARRTWVSSAEPNRGSTPKVLTVQIWGNGSPKEL